jgi:deoxyribodipyrimidine photo-lyase
VKVGLMWFRRDLRLADNAALHATLSACDRVYSCFVFDREILDKLEDRADRRVHFIHQSIIELNDALREVGAGLIVRRGPANEVIPELARTLKADVVYANHDYEPDRLARDERVREAMNRNGRTLETFKDHVIFEKNELLNSSAQPFKVYTQYKNTWRKRLIQDDYQDYCSDSLLKKLAGPLDKFASIPSLHDIGFEPTDLQWPGGAKAARQMLDDFLTRIDGYVEDRNFPAMEATSRLSVHLRFGTISIREVLREALAHGSEGAQKWIDELIWRDFYNMILHHFPRTEHEAFLSQYRSLPWRHDKKDFAAWCEAGPDTPLWMPACGS